MLASYLTLAKPQACRSRLRAASVVGAAIVALEVLDVLTTIKVVAAGGAELNPVMSVLMGVLGPVWWIPKVLLASAVAGYFGTRPSVGWRAIVVLILCAIVVFNNIAQLFV